MSVPFYNFTDLHNEEFKSQIKERINKIIDTNAYIDGEYNKKFEEEFGKLQGAKHSLLVANGTDAIEIALQALDIGHGDFVGVPGISFYATAEAVINRGATPVFVDVEPQTGLMSTESLKRVMKSHKLKAIIPVHIYGQPAPIEELYEICKHDNIAIIEDSAQGQGAFLKDGPVGSFPHSIVTFSFYPTKNLSAFGDAGAVLTNNPQHAEKILQIRNHGRSPEGHALVGRNSRCDHIHAAVLHLKLEKINQYNEMRRAIAKKYHQELKGTSLRLVPDSISERSSWHLYPVGLASREQKYALGAFLKERSIGNALFYERSMPEEKPLRSCAGETKESLDFAGKTICLPMNPFLTDAQIKTVCDAVKEFLKK